MIETKKNSNWRCFSELGCYAITEFSREGSLKRLLLTQLWGEIPDLARSSPQSPLRSEFSVCLFTLPVLAASCWLWEHRGWLVSSSLLSRVHKDLLTFNWESWQHPVTTSQFEQSEGNNNAQRYKLKDFFPPLLPPFLPPLDVLCHFTNQRKPWMDGVRHTAPLRNTLGSSLQRLYFLSFPP